MIVKRARQKTEETPNEKPLASPQKPEPIRPEIHVIDTSEAMAAAMGETARQNQQLIERLTEKLGEIAGPQKKRVLIATPERDIRTGRIVRIRIEEE